MISPILERIRPASMADILPESCYRRAIADGYAWAGIQHSYYYAICWLLRPRRILEIGVLDGLSMAAMLLGAGADCHGTGWDMEAYRAGSNGEARANLCAAGVGMQFDLYQVDSQKQKDFREDFDLIHVDGDHSYNGALSDLRKALDAKPGTILFDDYLSLPDCTRACDDFLIEERDRIVHSELITTRTGLMLIKV